MDIDEERYYELRSTAEEMLTVKDLVAVDNNNFGVI